MAVGSRFVTISWTLHYIQGSFDSTDIVYWALRRHYRITSQLYSGISRVMNSKLLQAFIDHTLILGLWQGWSHLLWMSLYKVYIYIRPVVLFLGRHSRLDSMIHSHQQGASWDCTSNLVFYFRKLSQFLTLIWLILRSRCRSWYISPLI